MNFEDSLRMFKKLFGKIKSNKNEQFEKKDESQRQMISFFDKNGKRYEVPKETYQQKVLPGIFENAWNDEQELYNSIIMALDDGFSIDCLEPAKHLQKIDSNKERGTTILGITFLRNESYKEAQLLFEQYISENGKSGVILTNLAKAFSFQGNEVRAKEILWEALELYPNLDNAVQWVSAIAREKGGEDAYLSTLEQISKLAGSWYADLWLARNDLEQNQKEKALNRYKKVLSLAPENIDALFMISGDLGKHGAIQEIIEIIYPVYKPHKHGVGPAMNLLQACFESKDFTKGVELLSE